MLLLLLFLILSWSLYILLLLLFFVSLVCPWRVCTFICREFLCGPMECWEESCNKASFSSFAFSCCRTTSTKHRANGHWTNDTTWRSKNDLAFEIGCDKHDILIHPVSWYSKNLLPKPWFLAAKVPCQWHVLVLSTAGGLCKIPRPWSSHHLPLKWILGPWWSQIWKKKWRKVGEKKQTKTVQNHHTPSFHRQVYRREGQCRGYSHPLTAENSSHFATPLPPGILVGTTCRHSSRPWLIKDCSCRGATHSDGKKSWIVHATFCFWTSLNRGMFPRNDVILLLSN